MPDAIDLELGELLSKLTIIQRNVGGGPKHKDHENALTTDGKIDRFLDIRNQIISRLITLKETLELKNRLEKSPGNNPKELIIAQSKIRTELVTIQDEFKELESAYAHETKKKRSKLSPEEINMRQQMIQKLQIEINSMKEIQRAGYVKGYQSVQMVSMENHEIFQPRDNNKSNGVNGPRPPAVNGQRNNEMTDDHRMQLHQIKERDSKIDEVIVEIGQGVDELRMIAMEANEEVKLQNKMLDTLESKIDNVHDHVTNINSNLKNTIEKARGSDKICCDIFCVLLLIGMIIVLVKLSEDRK